MTRSRLAVYAPLAAAFVALPLALRAQEKEEPGWLGVSFTELRGNIVLTPQYRSPAAEAGIAEGAILKTIDGKPAEGARSFFEFLMGAKPGQEVTLGWEAGGEKKSAKIAFAKRDYAKRGAIVLEDASRWLAKQQLPSGGFVRHVGPAGPDDAGSGLTALVARSLAELPEAPKKTHSATTKKAIEFLLGRAKATDGAGLGLVQDPEATAGQTYETYATALALIAMVGDDAKAWEKQVGALTKALVNRQIGRAPLEGFVFNQLDWQWGAWPFEANPVTERIGVRATVGATSMALEALVLAGLPKDDDAFKRARKYLELAQNFKTDVSQIPPQFRALIDGGFPESPRVSKAGVADVDASLRVYRSTGSTTADGLRALLVAGYKPTDARVGAAIDWLKKAFTVRENPGFEELKKEGTNEAQFESSIYFYWLATVARAFELADVRDVPDAKGGVRSWPNDIIWEVANRQMKDGSFKSKFGAMNEDNEIVASSFALLAVEASLRVKAKK